MSLLERVYYFHEELLHNRYPNATTLTRNFEVSIATARRDIAYLRDRLLAPLAFNQKKNGFYYTTREFTLPFEQGPKIFFFLGMLSKMAEEAGLGNLTEVRTLEKKLTGFIAPQQATLVDNIHCEWIEVEFPAPGILETTIEAITQRRVMETLYQSLSGNTIQREIEPQRLVNYQGRWYILAHCRLRKELRLFHLARFTKLALKRETFQPRQAQELDSHLNSAFGIFKGKEHVTASILFTGFAAEIIARQRWHKDQKIEKTEAGIILHIPVNDDREIMMKVLQYGSNAQVLAPERLKEKVKKEAAAILQRYTQGETVNAESSSF